MLEILMLIAIYYIIKFVIAIYKNIEVDNDNLDVYEDLDENINLASQENKYTKYFIYKNLRK